MFENVCMIFSSFDDFPRDINALAIYLAFLTGQLALKLLLKIYIRIYALCRDFFNYVKTFTYVYNFNLLCLMFSIIIVSLFSIT